MEYKDELQGLGGWLILVGIGVVLAPIRMLVNLVPVYVPIFTNGSWEVLTTEGSDAYHELWAPLLLGEIGVNACLVVASIFLIYLFFSKHYQFPRVYIGIVAASVIFIPLDAWLFSFVKPDVPIFDAETTREFARVGVGGMIWVPYMLISKRVKATFVKKPPAESMQDTGFASE